MMHNNLIKNSRVLVTGGAGFIGSNLIDRLIEQNNEVVCLDNFSSGRREYLMNAILNPNFTLINGDVRSKSDCQKAIAGCDFVIHHAAQASISMSVTDPVSCTETNIVGFVNILDAAVKEGIKRFVYASSSRIYGDNTSLPKIEHETGNALSPYAITKSVNEQFAQQFSALYGIETIGLRYFNVYGKRQNLEGEYTSVIPYYMHTFIKHIGPSIEGDGTQSHDFTHIDDVINAIQIASTKSGTYMQERLKRYCDNDKTLNNIGNSNTFSEVFNIALGSRTSLARLAQIIREKLAFFDESIRYIDFKYTYEKDKYVTHSLASTEKAKAILEFFPQVDINTGITQIAKWYFEQQKASAV